MAFDETFDAGMPGDDSLAGVLKDPAASYARNFEQDPPQSDNPAVADLMARLRQTKQQARDKYIKKYTYGSDNPGKGMKALGVLRTLLSIGGGVATPQQRASAQVDKDYEQETPRVLSEERTNAQIQMKNLQAEWEKQRTEMQRQNNESKNTIGTLLAGTKQDQADTQRIRALSQSALDKAKGLALGQNADTKSFMADISAIKDPFMQTLILEQIPEDRRQQLFGIRATQEIIKGLPKMMGMSLGTERSSGNSGFMDENGIAHTTTNSQNRKMMADPMQILQRLGISPAAGAPGMPQQAGPQAQPQIPGTQAGPGASAPTPQPPQAPPMQPQASAPPQGAPQAPPQAGGQPGQSLMQTLIQQNLDPSAKLPPGRYPKALYGSIKKEAEERADEIKHLKEYEESAGVLAHSIMSSVANGQDYRGVIKGHPLAVRAREILGNKTPEEQLNGALGLDTAMTYLKGKQSKFNRDEFNKTVSAQGGDAMTSPENASKGATRQVLWSQLEQGLRDGSLKPEDAPKHSAAIIEEMNRIGRAVSDLKAGKTKDVPEIRRLADILKSRSDAARSLSGGAVRSTGPRTPAAKEITLDDINAELARRKKTQ